LSKELASFSRMRSACQMMPFVVMYDKLTTMLSYICLTLIEDYQFSRKNNKLRNII